MGGLSEILDVARQALMSQQVGLDVTGHNISNANTLGYSRQSVDLTAATPLKYSFGFLGTGVEVSGISRIRDQMLDRQIQSTNASLGEAGARNTTLSQIESALNESSGAGLDSMLGKFFSSFQDLSLHPEDAGSRQVLLQQAEELTQTFQTTSAALTTTSANLVDDVNQKLVQVNELTKSISDLDGQITNGLAQGTEPSDLEDQRDQKIEALSKLMNVTVSRDSRGSTMVSVGGTVIASGGGAVALSASVSGGTLHITSQASGADVTVASGDIGGEVKMYNSTIPGYRTQLDQLASALITRVNTLHTAGYGLGTPPPTGNNFFTGTDAATIAVDPGIIADVNKIAASGDGSAGDNSVALAIAGVQSENIMNGGTASLAEAYSSLVSSVGADVSAANTDVQSQQAIYTQLDTQRSSVSGVSLDEEMTNTIKFQQAYDAAAKLVTTVNDMFITLIGMKES
ncbi:MAG TPA: flagellar hook-associated protein FlgK [Bacteroidota bacterium]|nr:flagellar hook-associated protein FlgK [Bacteroidota bacterium]